MQTAVDGSPQCKLYCVVPTASVKFGHLQASGKQITTKGMWSTWLTPVINPLRNSNNTFQVLQLLGAFAKDGPLSPSLFEALSLKQILFIQINLNTAMFSCRAHGPGAWRVFILHAPLCSGASHGSFRPAAVLFTELWPWLAAGSFAGLDNCAGMAAPCATGIAYPSTGTFHA